MTRFISAIQAFIREWRRTTWRKARIDAIQTPFD